MQDCIISIEKNEVSEYVKRRKIIIAMQRKSRGKCKQLAILELLQLLHKYKPQFLINGPLGDVKHSIPISLMCCYEEKNQMLKQLNGAGYTYKFYELCFDGTLKGDSDIKSVNSFTWKGCPFSVNNLFSQDVEEFRNQAADKRDFKLLCGDGIVRTIKGYRGDGTETGKRALAVEDCRLLMNLAVNELTRNFIDPFCGAGGIIYQVKKLYNNIKVYSNDCAAELEPGLIEYGSVHTVGFAEAYVSDVKFDSISTEIPFAPNATSGVIRGIGNIVKYADKECRIVIMVAEILKDEVCEGLKNANLYIGGIFDVNRKGTSVSIIIAFKDKIYKDNFLELMDVLKFVY